jgi:molecular chaperone GrpE
MNDTPDDPKAQDTAAQDNAGAFVSADGADGAGDLDRLRAENSDMRDKLLRAMAELENFRRRAEREKADLAKYAISDFARDAVSIADNLRRAIEAVPRDTSDLESSLKTLIEGIEVTERELLKVFERHGVTRFDPVGEKFDPHVHEAMIKVDVPNVPAETIVQVIQAGYMIQDRVLRPAAVIVAKGSVEAKPDAANAAKGYKGRASVGEPVAAGAAEQGQDEAQEPERAAQSNDQGAAGEGGDIRPFRQGEGEPDIPRGPGGGARKSQNAQAGEKRPSSMTKPVTDSSSPARKDEFISTFGKRLEN